MRITFRIINAGQQQCHVGTRLGVGGDQREGAAATDLERGAAPGVGTGWRRRYLASRIGVACVSSSWPSDQPMAAIPSGRRRWSRIWDDSASRGRAGW